MKNFNLYLILASATLLSACTSNKDLATLNEYDDIYYTGQPALTASLGSNSPMAGNMDDATDAERSYYENVPYSESNDEEAVADQDDYYEEDYATRIENFNGSNQGDYLYSNPSNNNTSINTSPNFNMNMMYGVGSYGSSFGMGLSYGSPGYGYGGYPFYDPFYPSPYYMSPWYRPYPYYGYYDPFRPTYCYGYGYGYGYSGYGGYYGGGGYYGNYPPYYGGGDYYGGNELTSTQRQNASSVRPSRGGVINPTSETDGRKSINDGPKNNTNEKSRDIDNTRRSQASGRTESVEMRRSEVQNSEAVSRQDYPRENNREYIRPGTSRSDFTPNEQQNRETRPVASPTYTPDRTINRNVVSPAQRSRSVVPSQARQRSTVAPQSRPERSAPTYNRGNSRSSSPTYNPPSRDSSPSRSVSPSNNNNSGGSSPSSSPSRGSRR